MGVKGDADAGDVKVRLSVQQLVPSLIVRVCLVDSRSGCAHRVSCLVALHRGLDSRLSLALECTRCKGQATQGWESRAMPTPAT
jgi:hypothetical protein